MASTDEGLQMEKSAEQLDNAYGSIRESVELGSKVTVNKDEQP
jgi:hypothetical protein